MFNKITRMFVKKKYLKDKSKTKLKSQNTQNSEDITEFPLGNMRIHSQAKPSSLTQLSRWNWWNWDSGKLRESGCFKKAPEEFGEPPQALSTSWNRLTKAENSHANSAKITKEGNLWCTYRLLHQSELKKKLRFASSDLVSTIQAYRTSVIVNTA